MTPTPIKDDLRVREASTEIDEDVELAGKRAPITKGSTCASAAHTS